MLSDYIQWRLTLHLLDWLSYPVLPLSSCYDFNDCLVMVVCLNLWELRPMGRIGIAALCLIQTTILP
jgi:hypothetical protein